MCMSVKALNILPIEAFNKNAPILHKLQKHYPV